MKKLFISILVITSLMQNLAKAEVAMIGVVDGMVCMACQAKVCLLYTSPGPRDKRQSRMPSSA